MFNNDGIMDHPTHQKQAQLESRPALDFAPTVQLLESKRKSIISPSVVHLRFHFRSVGDCDYFFVVSFIYVNNIFTILLTLHHNDTPYNLIYNYMDINLAFETSTTSVGLVSIDPGFVEK